MALSIRYNAPVVLTFSLICIGVYYLNWIFWGDTENNPNSLIGNVFTLRGYWNWVNPLDYLRLIAYPFGHSNQAHLVGNMSMMLLIAPIMEEKYGSKNILKMMAVTSIVSAVIHVLLFNTYTHGASGLVFMFIILASFADVKKGSIPLTFILVVFFYLGQEIINSFRSDNISQYAHIAGGIMGAVFGFSATTPTKKE